MRGLPEFKWGSFRRFFRNIPASGPIMLAIDGNSPIPVLEHLARDPEFDSRLIVSTIPMFLGEPLGDDRSLKWVRDFSEQKWSSRIETRLSAFVEQNLAFRSGSLAPEELLEHLQEGEWPSPTYAPMRPDRYRPGYFYKADVEAVRAARIEREQEFQMEATPLSEKKFLERVRNIDRMVKKIRKNGGDAVFVRFPSAGPVRAMERDSWPRRQYWDVLAERVDALFVHYEDYPALQGYRLPDESHLSFDEAVRFTRNLTRILIRNGFVSRATESPRRSLRQTPRRRRSYAETPRVH